MLNSLLGGSGMAKLAAGLGLPLSQFDEIHAKWGELRVLVRRAFDEYEDPLKPALERTRQISNRRTEFRVYLDPPLMRRT